MHQYLLTVAQKIIYKSAPTDIIKKYQELKKSISHKADISQIRKSNVLNNAKNYNLSSSASNLPINSNMKARSDSKTTAYSAKKQNLNQFDARFIKMDSQKFSSNASKKILRAQSRCSSTAQKNRNANYEQNYAVTLSKNRCQDETQSYELKCLQQLSLLLKNAQNCPRMLVNIQIPYEYEGQARIKVRRLFEKINQSLKNIFLKAQQQFKREKSAKQIKPIEVILPRNIQIPKEQMIQDNKWLIDKMELIIQENIVMRKMLGKQQS